MFKRMLFPNKWVGPGLQCFALKFWVSLGIGSAAVSKHVISAAKRLENIQFGKEMSYLFDTNWYNSPCHEFEFEDLIPFYVWLNMQSFQFKGYNMIPGFQGFLSLHAMVLQSVDELSDDNKSPAKTEKTPKETSSAAGSKGKPEAKTKKETKTTKTKSEKKNEKTESPKKKPSPKKVLKKPDDPKETPRKRPATSSTGASNSSPKGMKRPASKVDKGISISKYYYKNTDTFGFKINGTQKMTVACLNLWISRSMISYFNEILFRWYLISMISYFNEHWQFNPSQCLRVQAGWWHAAWEGGRNRSYKAEAKLEIYSISSYISWRSFSIYEVFEDYRRICSVVQDFFN